jgi:hypothetical protein
MKPGNGHSRWRPALRIFAALAATVLVTMMVVTRRDELTRITTLLRRANWSWVAVAAGAEAVSLLAVAAIQQLLLRAGGLAIRLRTLLVIALASSAISNSLPGGVAWANVYSFRQLRRRGADPVLAIWAKAGAGLLSAAALALLTAVGVLLAGGRAVLADLAWTMAVGGLVAAAVAVLIERGGLARLAIAGGTWLALGWRRLTRRPATDPRQQAEDGWRQLRAAVPHRRAWVTGLGLGLVNWVADCTCLAATLIAVGVSPPWPGLALAYAGGMLAACLPLLPSGLGLVEGGLVLGLVAYGGSGSGVVAAVLLYRAISLWALLPIGWGAWFALARPGAEIADGPLADTDAAAEVDVGVSAAVHRGVAIGVPTP